MNGVCECTCTVVFFYDSINNGFRTHKNQGTYILYVEIECMFVRAETPRSLHSTEACCWNMICCSDGAYSFYFRTHVVLAHVVLEFVPVCFDACFADNERQKPHIKCGRLL